MVLACGSARKQLVHVLDVTAAIDTAHAEGWQADESEEKGSELDE